MMGLREAIHGTRDGAEIAYRVRAGRDPWVLMHGLGCDASMWDEVVASLPGDVGLLLPECRGHGGSTLGWSIPSVDLWARDVLDLIETERLERPAVGGLSMGGYTALAVAALDPSRARAYAFISTAATADDAAARGRRAEGLATLRRSGWRAFADALLPLLLSDAHPRRDRLRRHLLAMFERAGEAGLTATLFGLAHRPDRRALLSDLAVPVVAVVGEADPLTPPARAEEIARLAPNARRIVLPATSHMSAMEAPERVAEALLGACGS